MTTPHWFHTIFFFLIGASSFAQRSGLPVSSRFHNRIDDLSATYQVEKFAQTISGDTGIHVSDRLIYRKAEYQRIADSLPYTPWLRTDIDGNGYTDLLLVGSWQRRHSVYCIMDSGGNNFTMHRLMPRGWPSFAFPEVIVKRKDVSIIFHWYEDGLKGLGKKKYDTLVYAYGGFIEKHQNNMQHHIGNIAFHVGYGWSGGFDISVDSTRHLAGMIRSIGQHTVINKDSIDIRTGVDTVVFHKILDIGIYTQLTGLLNYIGFESIGEKVGDVTTDVDNGTLYISYDKDRLKTINDNGLIGSYGLRRVYEIFFWLRDQ